MSVKKKNQTVETIILMTCIATFILFLVSLAFYISANYNYNPDGTVINDSEYKTAQIWKTVSYASAGVGIIAFIVFRLY